MHIYRKKQDIGNALIFFLKILNLYLIKLIEFRYLNYQNNERINHLLRENFLGLKKKNNFNLKITLSGRTNLFLRKNLMACFFNACI